MATSPADFPATLQIEYPDRELDRLTTFFRPFTVIPIALILGLVTRPTVGGTSGHTVLGAGGILFLPVALMIACRRKYPRWWFDWNLELTGFSVRVASYMALLTDEYPSTDEAQNVALDLEYPDVAHGLRPLAAARQVVPGDSRTTSFWPCSASRRSSPSRGLGSPSWSPAAIRGGCSTSSSGCPLDFPLAASRVPAHDPIASALQPGGRMIGTRFIDWRV